MWSVRILYITLCNVDLSSRSGERTHWTIELASEPTRERRRFSEFKSHRHTEVLLFFNLRCSLVLVVSPARLNDISIRGVVYFRSRVSNTCVSVPNSKTGVTQPIMHSPVIRGRLGAYALFGKISGEKNTRNFLLPRNEKLLGLRNIHSFTHLFSK